MNDIALLIIIVCSIAVGYQICKFYTGNQVCSNLIHSEQNRAIIMAEFISQRILTLDEFEEIARNETNECLVYTKGHIIKKCELLKKDTTPDGSQKLKERLDLLYCYMDIIDEVTGNKYERGCIV